MVCHGLVLVLRVFDIYIAHDRMNCYQQGKIAMKGTWFLDLVLYLVLYFSLRV